MAKKEDKKSKPESKTPELTKAKKALDAYLKENKLDPTKDWTKDKKHGKKITELVNKLNKERDKVAAAYPEKDADNNKKLVKLKEKKEKEKAGKKEEKKEKKSAGRTATKYDYPLIDGREMTSAEKKKYRMEQRKLASGNAPKEEKEAKKAKKEKVKEKPASDKKEKKANKKKDKKKKKAAKEED
jgi:hypothetical protein